MSDLGPLFLDLAVQVTLPVLGGLLLSRRHDPAAACVPLVFAAVAIVVITPVAFMPRIPWPVIASSAPCASQDSISDTAPAAASRSPGIDLLKLLQLAKPGTPIEPAPRFHPWQAVAWIGLGLAALGLARFTLALIQTVRVIRRSRVVEDPRLQVVVKDLTQLLGCRTAIEVRESSYVGSAATAGWRRTLVLLSPAWRLWSDAERRAVLAHEIAHVVRRDFRWRLIARLAAALHIYHPLVRWLMSRLELRQELAADALAARCCGGRATYLKSLAALALKFDARPVAVVPTFLSRPRTLLRRIAMLRVKEDCTVRARRWPTLAAIALLAGIALGLRGTTPESLAGPIIPAKFIEKKERPPLDSSFVIPSNNENDVGVFAIRVGELCRMPGMDKMAEAYTAMLPQFVGDKKVNFALTDIEQIAGRVSLTYDPKKPAPNHSLSMSLTSIRMAKEFDWPKQLQQWCTEWKEHAHAGTTYYSGKATIPALGFKDVTVWFYVPDSRSAVLESEENIKKLIDQKGKPVAPPWADDWKAVDGGTLAMVLPDTKRKLLEKLIVDAKSGAVEKAALSTMASICKKSSRAAVGADLGTGLSLRIRMVCANGMDAADVDAGCQALIKLARSAVDSDMKTLSAELVRGVEFSKTADHIVEVRMTSKTGVADLLKSLNASVDAK